VIGQVLAELNRILSILGTILGLVQGIQGQNPETALEPSPFAINTGVQEELAILEDGTFGLAALQAQLATFQATTALDITALVTQIGSPQQSTLPVILPDPITVNLGAGAVSDITTGIQEMTLPITGVFWLDALESCFNFAQSIGSDGGYPAKNSPFVLVTGSFASALQGIPAPQPPQPDWQLAPTFSTLLDWLNGTTAYTWLVDEPSASGLYFTDDGIPGTDYRYYCILTEQMFALLLGRGSITATGVPLWPGLANVTLGTPVALDVGVTITTPMDGVLVAVTAVPANTSFFQFDDVESYRFIGALAFFSDDGDEEFPQNLGFQNAVYCPKAMTEAAGVKVRTKPGIVGTVTPWLHV